MMLSLAVIPLVMFTNDRSKMGEFVNPPWVKYTGWALALVIAILNAYLLWQTFTGSAPA
jgi:manganese transport protein